MFVCEVDMTSHELRDKCDKGRNSQCGCCPELAYYSRNNSLTEIFCKSLEFIKGVADGSHASN